MRYIARHLFAVMLALGLAQGAVAQWDEPAGSSFDLGGGSMDLACQPVTIAGNYTLSGGTLTNAGSVSVAAGGVLDVTGSFEMGADFSNLGTVNAPGTVLLDGVCAAPGARISVSGTAVFNDLTISSTTGQTFVFQAGTSITVNGNLTVSGLPGQPVTLLSATGQLITIALGPNAHVTQSNVVLTNVVIGALVPQPASATAVPVLDNLLAGILSLLVFLLAFGVLRGRRASPVVQRRPEP